MGRTKLTSGQKQSKTKAAKKAFNEWYPTRPDKTEEYRRCKTVPYWFVSNKGNIKSFEDPSNPIDINQYSNDKYKQVSASKYGVKTTQYVHRLMAEVGFHVPTFGKAKNRKNLKGFEVHHTEADKRNEADALQILTPKAHGVLNHIPTDNSPEKEIEYLKKISATVRNEAPDQAVVITSGKGISVASDTGIETPIDGLTQRFFTADDPGFNEFIEQVKQAVQAQTPTVSTLNLYTHSKEDSQALKALISNTEKRETLIRLLINAINNYDLKIFEYEITDGLTVTVTIEK